MDVQNARTVDDMAGMENLPDDTAEIERMMNGEDQPEDGPLDADDATGGDTADEMPETDGKDRDKADDASDEPDPKNTVIKTRDGKHEMPFSVLQKARDKAREAQEQLDALNAERETDHTDRDKLAARIKELEAAQSQVEADTGTEAGEGEAPYEHLRDEMPDEIVDALNAQHQQIQALQGSFGKLNEREQKAAADAEQTAEQQVREALDNNPTLLDWEANNPALFSAAIAVDNHLREQPDWANQALGERFDEVVKRLTGQTDDAPAPPAAADTAKDTDAKARAAVERATEDTPTTHSDLAGGQASPQSEEGKLEAMTPTDIEARFDQMSEEQQQEYLARYG
jgi:chromosome segregation ATPase